MTILYSLREVEQRFDEHRALSIPALDLEAGGVTALVGPNGAGKTTLLRLFAFFDRPTRGTVALAETTAKSHIVYVDQAPFLFRGTVESNVAYGLRVRGVPRNERRNRIGHALEAVGLGAHGRRRANRLSGGERRRAALARALVLSPAVLLLDEPFAEVDQAHVTMIERALVDEGKRRTVILTTHDLAQAHRVADRVLSLVAGRVSAVPLVNAFRGAVASRHGAPVFVASGVELEVMEGHPGATLAAIDPEAVVVSIEPVHSSARNSFRGVVVGVEARKGSFHLTVDCGVRVVAAVTRHSYEELDLNVGREVWVTFKSTAVHLY